MRKIPNKKCYRVYNSSSKRVFAKCSTLKNAKKQMSLLRSIERKTRKTNKISKHK